MGGIWRRRGEAKKKEEAVSVGKRMERLNGEKMKERDRGRQQKW